MQAEHETNTGGMRMKGIFSQNSAYRPLVTVVTAVFNGQAYLAGCLESVLRQDYPNIEHIVLDGGSSDGTVEVLRKYDDRIAYWKSESDKGIYDAWNKALAMANGEWICFLGVDDVLLPGAVSAYMDLAQSNPQAEYMSSRVRWVHPSGYQFTYGKPWKWPHFSRLMCIAHVGSMHRRSLYERLGTYDTSYRSAADYEFLLRARSHLNTVFMPTTTVLMRAGGISDDSSVLHEAKRAKILSGGRNRMLAELDLYFASAVFLLRPLRRALNRIRAARPQDENGGDR
jgi:glycosyltransferase involved in cell wall biosynthesis